VVAVVIGQATMVRPLFTRRFWDTDPLGSSAYSANKPSNRYESHELTSGSNHNSKASRLGFRALKDPYNVSVLRTQGNGSEEKIIPAEHDNGFMQREESQTSDQSERGPKDGIFVRTEVDISTATGKQGYRQSWKAV